MNFDKQYKEEKCLRGLNPSPIVKSLLNYKKSGKVLDIGAGEGRNSIFLAKNGFDVTALDISKEAGRKLKELASKEDVKINILIEDIINFEFKEKYNIIISIATLHFLRKKYINKVIERVKENTKKGGLNAISVFTEENPNENFPYLFKTNELKELYNGWEILSYKEFITPLEKHDKAGKWHKHGIAVIIAKKN